jgi:stearoyl-CoA desaturase (delta-9 desaturase)
MSASATVPTGTSTAAVAEGSADRTDWIAAIPFFAVHVAPLAAIFVSVTWQDWVLCAVLYVTRMFFITAGYHRYFSHRSYRMHRVTQFLMAVGGTTAVQKGPLWWAAHHRVHHRYTDVDGDVHSPRDGFWWSHVGWILSTKYKATDLSNIKDFAAYPELRLLERFQWIPPWLLAIACFLVGGWGGLLIGFFLSTVLLWHGTFLVNSATHLFGRRRYATPDTSRNSLIIAVITGGEGWHNNHHYLPASSRQGFTWWEFDPTWYVLRGLAAVRVVRDLRDPPARLLDQARVRDGAFDIGMFRSYWEKATKRTGERIADLSARPLHASGEATADLEPVPQLDGATTDGVGGPTPTDGVGGPTPTDDTVTQLSGLISRVLESADQLAGATRRSWHGTKVGSGEPGPGDHSPE